MLNWPSRLILHHVIFACKSTYTISKDTRKPLKQLVSGDRGSSRDIMCINSTLGRLWSVQLVVVSIRNNVHSKARFNDQNRPNSLAFNQIADKQTSEISTPYTRMNFPEDRNLSTTIRNNRRIDRCHIAQIKIFGRLLVQIQKGQHCTELLCRAETKDNIQIPTSALPVENHLARDVGLGACPQHTFAKCFFMPHLLQLCP